MLRPNAPPNSAPNAPRNAPRNASLDIARLIASFGIVVFHLGAPGAAIGYAALPFFLMLLIILALPAARTKSFGDFAKSRATRLLKPWLVWSAVYGLLKLAEVALSNRQFSDEFKPYMLLTGTAIHLWFLPFAFAASLILPALVAVWPKAGMARRAGILALVGLGFTVLGLRQGGHLPIPFAQWGFVLPSLALGLALALCKDNREDLRWVFIPSLAAFLGLALALGWTDGLLQLALATCAVLVCFAIKLPKNRFTQLCADTSMGVYLVHPLILALALKVPGLPAQSMAMALVVMALSFGFSVAVNAVKQHMSGRLWRTPQNASST